MKSYGLTNVTAFYPEEDTNVCSGNPSSSCCDISVSLAPSYKQLYGWKWQIQCTIIIQFWLYWIASHCKGSVWWYLLLVPATPPRHGWMVHCLACQDEALKCSSGSCPSLCVSGRSHRVHLLLWCAQARVQVCAGNYSICLGLCWLFFISTWSPLQKTNYPGEY